MSPFATILSPVMEAMHEGRLVLTPNHRVRVQLLESYGQWRKEKKLSAVCVTPQIFPVDIWIRTQWENMQPLTADDCKLILEPLQEGRIWQDIVRDSGSGTNLVSKSGTARSVQEAWQLTHLFNMDLNEWKRFSSHRKNQQDSDDYAAFLEWVGEFQDFCQKNRLISLSPLVAEVTDRISKGQIKIPENILLSGFSNPPPRYADLINVLKMQGKHVYTAALPDFTPSVAVQACKNNDYEILEAARWAEQVLQENPHSRIGIVSQDIYKNSGTFERIFNQVFHGGSLHLSSDSPSRVFNLSVQKPLMDSHLISIGMIILELNNPWIETLRFCRLLRSPCLGFSAEADSQDQLFRRASLEKQLRLTSEMSLQLHSVRYFCNRENKPYSNPALSEALLAFDTLRREASDIMTCSDWADLFERQLHVLQWPGSMISSQEETRQLNAWSSVVKTFKQSSAWYGKVRLPVALSLLQALVNGNSISRNREQSPIQILTPIEADGVYFSHCWHMGLSESQWPPVSTPSPFIPLALQKKAGMAQGDVTRMTMLAREQLHQLLCHTSNEIVFSYPCQSDDLSLKPAEILEEYSPELPTAVLDNPTPIMHPAGLAMAQTNQTQLLKEECRIPLLHEEELTGGVAILGNQAECPFRAFSLHRLKADPLPAPVIGLPGHALGSIIHEALEIFWQNLRSLENLTNRSKATIDQIISSAVSSALANQAARYPFTMTGQFVELEKIRLSALLKRWLDEESKRGLFTVAESEFPVEWKHHRLKLSMRVDRIDTTPEGKHVVIDYKSSSNPEIKWTEERQTDPQLMLYMLALENNEHSPLSIDGLFIAQIHIDDCRYKGISNDDSLYPGSIVSSKRSLPEDCTWESLKDLWEDSLTQLANQYLEGFALVDPKSAGSCTWCHLGAFCRVNDVVNGTIDVTTNETINGSRE